MSSYLIAAPEAVGLASNDLSGIGAAVEEATAAAAPSTTRIAAAAGDEVSTAIARLFGSFADEFHTLTARAILSGRSSRTRWARPRLHTLPPTRCRKVS